MTREQYEDRLAALCARYPYLFSGKHLEYDIAPGWLGIMEALCAHTDATLTPGQKDKLSFMQIKEKFGGLRASIEGAPLRLDIFGKGGLRVSGRFEKDARSDAFSRIAPLLDAAEAESYRTCILCGAPGRLRQDRSWWLTLCDTHERCSYRDLTGSRRSRGRDAKHQRTRAIPTMSRHRRLLEVT
jgi:hypothetical protein